MPTARIITRFPDRAASLRKTLSDSGYKVQIVSPEQPIKGLVDIEYDLDAMPEFAPAAADAGTPLSSQPSTEQIAQTLAAKREAEAKERERRASEAHVKEMQEQAEAARRAAAAQERERAARESRQKQQREAARQAQIMAQLQERSRAEAEAKRQTQLRAQREAERMAAVRAAEKRKAAEVTRIAAHEAAERRRQQIDAKIAHARDTSRAAWTKASETTFRLADEGKAWWQTHAPVYRRKIARTSAALAAWITQQSRSFGPKISAARVRVSQSLRDWSKITPSQSFSDTRDYAFRQAVPVAAALASVFVLGWALAVGNTEHARTRDAAAETSLPVTPAITATPVAATATIPLAKPSAASPKKATITKSTVRGSRRQTPPAPEATSADEDDEQEVVIIHHRPEHPTIRNKEGLKTISDLE